MNNIFLPNKKKKREQKIKKMRRPDWPQFRPPAGPETEVLFSLAWFHHLIESPPNHVAPLGVVFLLWDQQIKIPCHWGPQPFFLFLKIILFNQTQNKHYTCFHLMPVLCLMSVCFQGQEYQE